MVDKLPPSAKRVFRGKVFEIWQWEQKLFDGTSVTFERAKRKDSVVILPIVGRKILIQFEKQPDKPKTFITLPGGQVDEGETATRAAKRELQEETGYTSRAWQLWLTQTPGFRTIWTIRTFIARDCKKVAQPSADPGERIKIKLVSFGEFLKLATRADFRNLHLKELMLRARYEKKFRVQLEKTLFKK